MILSIYKNHVVSNWLYQLKVHELLGDLNEKLLFSKNNSRISYQTIKAYLHQERMDFDNNSSM